MAEQESTLNTSVTTEKNLTDLIEKSPDIKEIYFGDDMSKPIIIKLVPEKLEYKDDYDIIIPFVLYPLGLGIIPTIEYINWEGIRTIKSFSPCGGITFEHRDFNTIPIVQPNREQKIKDILNQTKRGLDIFYLFASLSLKDEEFIMRKYPTLFNITPIMKNNQFPLIYTKPLLEYINILSEDFDKYSDRKYYINYKPF